MAATMLLIAVRPLDNMTPSRKPQHSPAPEASDCCLLVILKEGIVMAGPAAGANLPCFVLKLLGRPCCSSDWRCGGADTPAAGALSSKPMPHMRVCKRTKRLVSTCCVAEYNRNSLLILKSASSCDGATSLLSFILQRPLLWACPGRRAEGASIRGSTS